MRPTLRTGKGSHTVCRSPRSPPDRWALAVAPLASIYDLAPTEEGGSVARAGFNYQDHIAARFCIAMLGDGHLSEVWCETEDDVTLIWKNDGAVTVEFVQVKSHELTQLWSIALLCAGSPNDSIISKSLAHDRCTEPCCFRIVSRTGMHPDLHPLRLDRSHADRCLSNPAIRKLHHAVSAAMQSIVSEQGRSASNWLAETMWEVCESEQSIIAQNRWYLQEHLEYRQEALFTDQLRELYDQVLFRVQQASFRKWRDGADAKKFTNQEFETWLLEKVHQIKGHAPTKAGLNLERKMSEALLPESAIENADDLRRAYRGRMLDPKYQQDSGLRNAELEVAATLQHLLSDLDAGNLTERDCNFMLAASGRYRAFAPSIRPPT